MASRQGPDCRPSTEAQDSAGTVPRHTANLRRAARLAAPLLLLAALWAALSLPADAMRRETLTLVTAQGPREINIEVTETMAEMQKGLMFRTHLDENAGMLFVYDRPQEVGMWMENTHIPLDMVFIRADGIVHRIQAWTEPFSRETIGSRGNVIACLELAGGAAERMGLKAGDRVEHSAFKTKPAKK
jgi:uncharacterized protein